MDINMDVDIKNKLAKLFFILMVVGAIIWLIAVIIATIRKYKDDYWFGGKTIRYIYGERIEILKNLYPYWEFNPHISKYEIKRIIRKYRFPSKLLYQTGMLTNTSGRYIISAKTFVTVTPGYASGDDIYDTVHSECIFFEIKSLNRDTFKMPGIINITECYKGLSNQMNKAFNSIGTFFSDLGERKNDMNAVISGNIIIDNVATITYSGVPRYQWNKVLESGFVKEAETLCSAWNSHIKLFYEKGKMIMQAEIVIDGARMSRNHNDFIADNPELINLTAEKMTILADIIDNAP